MRGETSWRTMRGQCTRETDEIGLSCVNTSKFEFNSKFQSSSSLSITLLSCWNKRQTVWLEQDLWYSAMIKIIDNFNLFVLLSRFWHCLDYLNIWFCLFVSYTFWHVFGFFWQLLTVMNNFDSGTFSLILTTLHNFDNVYRFHCLMSIVLKAYWIYSVAKSDFYLCMY